MMKSNKCKKTVQYPSARVAFAALMLISSCAANAEEGLEPETSLAYRVGAVSDYRVRGISQTSGDPAAQGGIDLTSKLGLYLGAAISNQKWVKDLNGATKSDVELDFYGGFKAQIPDTGISYDLGVITYQYPGNNSGADGTPGAGLFSNANTVETYLGLGYSIFTLKYNRSVGNFLGNLNSTGSQYFDLSAAIDLTHGFTLIPHIGRQLIPNQIGNQGNYTDMALTVSKDFGNGFSGSVAGIFTNANKTFYRDMNGKYLGNNTAVVGVTYSF